jgi:seryl-tRNA synthetase
MLSMETIKRNRADVERAIRDKGVRVDLDGLLAQDSQIRGLKGLIEGLRAERNINSSRFPSASAEEKSILGQRAKQISETLKEHELSLAIEETFFQEILLKLPGIPWEGAPIGPDEDSNVVIRTEGALPSFDFEPLDHVALIEKNDWAELARIVHVSGSRMYCLKGRLALLETMLMGWALHQVSEAGFTPITVPSLAKHSAFVGTGHFPGHEDEAYAVPADDLFLAGTGEIALTSLHSGEILDGASLPITYAGLSPCFRREAGSAGRDVRGLLRVHQFLKVEAYVICENDEAVSAEWHARLLALAEHLLSELEIPYQVIETSTGDMGLGKYRMNDIESWVPTLGKYRETHSCSTLHEWQARRANLRYRDGDGKVRFAHTLNNTALASPRILVPLLENHQTADGRVRLPKALRAMMGGGEFL